MTFNILFGMLFHQGTWKLAAATAVAEILLVKTGLDFTFQTGLAFAVITD